MGAAMEKAKQKLASLDPRYEIHINRDDSIDGEFRVPMGEEYETIYPELIEHMPWMRGVWLSVHDYWHPSMEDAYENQYMSRRGMVGIASHPVMRTHSYAQTRAIYGQLIAQRVEEETRLKPLETVIHMRWHPAGKRPKS
jgi:hypothetical protein